MIRSCVTVSLVAAARGGPFVFWDDFAAACRQAAALEFDAVELFPPGSDSIDTSQVRAALADHHLNLAAVGTGAGWVQHGLSLTAGDADVRKRAVDFVRSIIKLAGEFGAATIIGSMQGRTGEGVDSNQALTWLAEALGELADDAASRGSRLVVEPLNRYETDLVNTLTAGSELLRQCGATNLKLLADLFHMNIEEVDIAAAIRTAGADIGHVHWVDSNRRAAGMGHLEFAPIAAALINVDYDGYVSAEALPLPDTHAAAAATIKNFRDYFSPAASV